MRFNEIAVKFHPVNGEWLIVGGGLPEGTAWSGHATEQDACEEAVRIADDIGASVVHS